MLGLEGAGSGKWADRRHVSVVVCVQGKVNESVGIMLALYSPTHIAI